MSPKNKFTPRLVAVTDRRGDVLLSGDKPARHVRDMLDSRRHRPGSAAMATRIPDRAREEEARRVRLILVAMAWGSAVVGAVLLLLEFWP